MHNLLDIKTLEDLHRALQTQRSITTTVTMELDQVVKGVMKHADANDEAAVSRVITQREIMLLHHYAILPTLVEHSQSAQLRSAMQAGATFGVSAIVGQVLLTSIRTITPDLPRAHCALLTIALLEIGKPESDTVDLVDVFMRSMKIELDETVRTYTPAEKAAHLRSLLQPLAATILLVAQQYALITFKPSVGYNLTALGMRVLLHLTSSQIFIDTVTAAQILLSAEQAASPQKGPALRKL